MFIGLQAAHRDDAVVGLAERAEVLAADVRGLGAVLAVPGFVNDERTGVAGLRRRIALKRFQTAGIDGLLILGRLRQEELQALNRAMLSAQDRLGAGEGSQGLVPIAGQQQARQVVAKAATLGERAEQIIELSRIVFQRTGSDRAGNLLGHGVVRVPPPKVCDATSP